MTPTGLPNPADHPRLRAALYLLAGLAAGALFVGGIVVVAQILSLSSDIRDTQVDRAAVTDATREAALQAKQAAEDAARSADRIEDCTTPGRECFEDAKQRTEKAIVGINRGTLTVIVAAISCQVDGVAEQEALARCTVKRSRTASPRPPGRDD